MLLVGAAGGKRGEVGEVVNVGGGSPNAPLHVAKAHNTKPETPRMGDVKWGGIGSGKPTRIVMTSGAWLVGVRFTDVGQA